MAAIINTGAGSGQSLVACAVEVGQACDALVRWKRDGSSGPESVLTHLIEARERVLASADPDLAAKWRELDARVWELYGTDFGDEYEVAQELRDIVFAEICAAALATAV